MTDAWRSHHAGWLWARLLPIWLAVSCWLMSSLPASAQDLPELTRPVNDVARVIDPASAAAIDRLIRELDARTGDAVVVATIDTVAPFADIREYSVKMFENHGRGIGRRGRDNGVLLLLAVRDRQVRMEVGYELESVITDGTAGEISRHVMRPYFQAGRYGEGLLAGVEQIVARIARARGVTLNGTPVSDAPPARRTSEPPIWLLFLAYAIFAAVRRLFWWRAPGRARRWGSGTWSGWSSGVGPFGGGGGGFGGGFGGFGGGRSGGGGGGASW